MLALDHLVITTYIGTDEGTASNVLYFLPNTTWAANTNWDNEATALDTAVNAAYNQYLSSDCTYLGARYQFHRTGVTQVRDTYLNVAGSQTGGALPAEDAGVVQLYSAQAGRTGRGRIFLTGIPEENVNQSKILTGSLATFNGIINMMTTNFSGMGTTVYRGQVYSRKNNTVYQCTSARMALVLGNIRRRRPVR